MASRGVGAGGRPPATALPAPSPAPHRSINLMATVSPVFLSFARYVTPKFPLPISFSCGGKRGGGSLMHVEEQAPRYPGRRAEEQARGRARASPGQGRRTPVRLYHGPTQHAGPA